MLFTAGKDGVLQEWMMKEDSYNYLKEVQCTGTLHLKLNFLALFVVPTLLPLARPCFLCCIFQLGMPVVSFLLLVLQVDWRPARRFQPAGVQNIRSLGLHCTDGAFSPSWVPHTKSDRQEGLGCEPGATGLCLASCCWCAGIIGFGTRAGVAAARTLASQPGFVPAPLLACCMACCNAV